MPPVSVYMHEEKGLKMQNEKGEGIISQINSIRAYHYLTSFALSYLTTFDVNITIFEEVTHKG